MEGSIEVTEDETEDVSIYWMTLRKGKDTGNLKRKQIYRTLWRTRFGRGYGHVVTDYRINEGTNE